MPSFTYIECLNSCLWRTQIVLTVSYREITSHKDQTNK